MTDTRHGPTIDNRNAGGKSRTVNRGAGLAGDKAKLADIVAASAALEVSAARLVRVLIAEAHAEAGEDLIAFAGIVGQLSTIAHRTGDILARAASQSRRRVAALQRGRA